jgi:hypothetical protein
MITGSVCMDSKVKWSRNSKLETSDTLEKFEADFNVVLPESFKSFIVKNNYGSPTPDSVIISEYGETDIKRLLSFNHNDTETIYEVVEFFSKKNLVPFASDSYGNYYCLSGESVLFWEHEEDAIYDLSCGFNDFLQMIH